MEVLEHATRNNASFRTLKSRDSFAEFGHRD
jgi:hypothetical protein